MAWNGYSPIPFDPSLCAASDSPLLEPESELLPRAPVAIPRVSHREPPAVLPDGLQYHAGFCRFMKDHSSPPTRRVTAGGRVVPAGPNSPPPTFRADFIDSVLETLERERGQNGTSPPVLESQVQATVCQRMPLPSSMSANYHASPFGRGPTVPTHSTDKSKVRATEPLLQIPADMEVIDIRDNGRAALLAGTGGYYRADLDSQGRTLIGPTSMDSAGRLTKPNTVTPGADFTYGPALNPSPLGTSYASSPPGHMNLVPGEGLVGPLMLPVAPSISSSVPPSAAGVSLPPQVYQATCPVNPLPSDPLEFPKSKVYDKHVRLQQTNAQLLETNRFLALNQHKASPALLQPHIDRKGYLIVYRDEVLKSKRAIEDLIAAQERPGASPWLPYLPFPLNPVGYILRSDGTLFPDPNHPDRCGWANWTQAGLSTVAAPIGPAPSAVGFGGPSYVQPHDGVAAAGRSTTTKLSATAAEFVPMSRSGVSVPSAQANGSSAFTNGTSINPRRMKPVAPFMENPELALNVLRLNDSGQGDVEPVRLESQLYSIYHDIWGQPASADAIARFRTWTVRYLAEAAVSLRKGGESGTPDEINAYIDKQFVAVWGFEPTSTERGQFGEWPVGTYVEYSMECKARRHVPQRSPDPPEGPSWKGKGPANRRRAESDEERMERHLKGCFSPPIQPLRSEADKKAFLEAIHKKHDDACLRLEQKLKSESNGTTDQASTPIHESSATQSGHLQEAAANTSKRNLQASGIRAPTPAVSTSGLGAFYAGGSRSIDAVVEAANNASENKFSTTLWGSRIALKCSSSIAVPSLHASGIFDGSSDGPSTSASAATALLGGRAFSSGSRPTTAIAVHASDAGPSNPRKKTGETETGPSQGAQAAPTNIRGGFTITHYESTVEDSWEVQRALELDLEAVRDGVNIDPSQMHANYGRIIEGASSLHPSAQPKAVPTAWCSSKDEKRRVTFAAAPTKLSQPSGTTSDASPSEEAEGETTPRPANRKLSTTPPPPPPPPNTPTKSSESERANMAKQNPMTRQRHWVWSRFSNPQMEEVWGPPMYMPVPVHAITMQETLKPLHDCGHPDAAILRPKCTIPVGPSGAKLITSPATGSSQPGPDGDVEDDGDTPRASKTQPIAILPRWPSE